MSVIRSAILSQEQKEVLKDSILSYVTTLQKRFYKDSLITEEIYHEKMQQIQDIVNVLHPVSYTHLTLPTTMWV